MDQQDLYAIEARCTQEAPPRCRTACPFGLDVRAFLEKLEAGKPAEARKILERHVPLPELMARVCDHPCESACVRRDLGGGLAVNALERFCVENSNAGKTLPRPPKAGTVAIFGNGLAGLVAAADLAPTRAATTLQRLLEGVSLTAVRDEADKPGETRLHVRLDGIVPEPRVVPEAETFSAEEAVREAGRCIRCSCLACVKECVFLHKCRSFPRAYARQIYNNMSIVKGQHLANRLVTSCTLCGQCTEICPERFSMAELCLEARRDMVDRTYMPPSAYEFAVQDMADATGPAAFVVQDIPKGAPAMSVSKDMADFTLSCMAFQDALSLDLARVRGCCIHVASPDGRRIPFCLYNLTATGGEALYRGR